MYQWYQNADVCYAFLADVPSITTLEDSRWFTRGWTLQELTAPSKVVFLNDRWEVLGTKASLHQEISDCTRIPVDILLGGDPEGASVAQRMSWAATRQTTRLEDRAYSLMGLFGVNMPLLYGEGEKAFVRLQEEILKISDDHSIFAWRSHDNRGGILATSPDAFIRSGNIIPRMLFSSDDGLITVSNKGIHLGLHFMARGGHGAKVYPGVGLGILNCVKTDDDRPIAIYLRDIFLTMQHFERVRSEGFRMLDLTPILPPERPMRKMCVRLGRMRHQQPKHADASDESDHEDLYFDGAQTPLSVTAREILLDADVAKTWYMQAARQGDVVLIQKLLRSGSVQVDVKDSTGMTALMHAAANNHSSVVWLLLTRNDITPAMIDNENWNVIIHAAKNGHDDILRALLARSDTRDAQTTALDAKLRAPLSFAAEAGHEAVVRLLLATDKFAADYADLTGNTPLTYAYRKGHVAIVELLLAAGRVDVHLKVYHPRLLFWAVDNGHETITRLLFERGFDINSRRQGWTPLLSAAVRGHTGVVKVLLERDADVDAALTTEAEDKNNKTSLMLGAIAGHLEIVSLLLANGAQTDVKDMRGNTALLYAAAAGRLEVVKVLLDGGSDLQARNNGGYTAVMLAQINKRTETLDFLLHNGGKLEELPQRPAKAAPASAEVDVEGGSDGSSDGQHTNR